MNIPVTLSLSGSDLKAAMQDGCIILHSNGDISIEGSVKIAALALASYIMSEYCSGMEALLLNESLVINFNDNYRLIYLKEKPAFFDELEREFQKIVAMKMFW